MIQSAQKTSLTRLKKASKTSTTKMSIATADESRSRKESRKEDNQRKQSQQQPQQTQQQSRHNHHQQRPGAVLNLAAAYGGHLLKSKAVNFKVRLKCTDELFNVVGIPLGMPVRELKACLEFICGIPFELQRLSYLDEGEMVDHKELLYYDVIDGATLDMDVWTPYVALVKACVLGSNGIEDVLKQGVSLRVEWHAPTSDYMFKKDRFKYITDRSGIAAFIAAHRGNLQLLKGLVSYGAHINYASGYGRTPIMVSVVAYNSDVIDYLLERDVNIDMKDINGDTALAIAKKFNNKVGQYRLTQHKWKKRTEAERKKSREAAAAEDAEDLSGGSGGGGYLPHQVFDSAKKTWLKGDFMQIYMMHLTGKPEEFSGSALSAPKSVGMQLLRQRRELQRSISDMRSAAIGATTTAAAANRKSTDSLEQSPLGSLANLPTVQSGITFDMWLNKKQRAERLEKSLNAIKKIERSASLDNGKEEIELNRPGSVKVNNPENSLWMKDYIKASMMTRSNLIDTNFAFGSTGDNNNNNKNSMESSTTVPGLPPLTSDPYVSSDMFNSSSSNPGGGLFKNSSASASARRRAAAEFADVYKGMSYDEWIEVRNKFLKSHPMNNK